MCPHGGVVNHIPVGVNTYRINGELPMMMNDQFIIAGCPFVMSGAFGNIVPRPCRRVQWTSGSNFLFIRGIPALTNTSNGLCMGSGPPLPVIIASFQTAEREPNTVTRIN